MVSGALSRSEPGELRAYPPLWSESQREGVMPTDIDGYGFPGGDRTIGRLIGDLREMDRAGIERVARGWDRDVGDAHLDRFRAAEQTAMAELEKSNRVGQWDEVRTLLFSLTEGKGALASWKSEHGEAGAKAERAALAAALGLVAGPVPGHHDLAVLLQPMAEALPWLLVDDPPNKGGE